MMRMISLAILAGLLVGTGIQDVQALSQKKEKKMGKRSVLDFTMKTIDGKPRPLSDFKGNLLLIVNTASECGNTPQYASLQKLYETYREQGLRILAFPSNDFGAQEPGTDAEIKTFCSVQYGITFDLFAKISVKGKDIHPLYAFITSDSAVAGDVKWNFQKYLVDRSGNIVAKFLPGVDPISGEVKEKIESLLKPIRRDERKKL